MPGPRVDQEFLRKAGIDSARLETIAASAPKDFKAAVVFVSGTKILMGWFLGNYFELQKPIAVQKSGGESVKITLAYRGALPQIMSLQ